MSGPLSRDELLDKYFLQCQIEMAKALARMKIDLNKDKVITLQFRLNTKTAIALKAAALKLLQHLPIKEGKL